VRRRRAWKNGLLAERFTNREIYERDKWVCQLCRRNVDSTLAYPHPLSASLDHIMPKSRGGDHIRANVQLAHLACNLEKRDRVLGDGEQLRLIG
jgi:5-methylcytosine-specific restriction endonuclease McrA